MVLMGDKKTGKYITVNKKRQNTLEINGKLYDAASGLPIKADLATKDAKDAKTVPTVSVQKNRVRGTNMDGFIGKTKSNLKQTRPTPKDPKIAIDSFPRSVAKKPIKVSGVHRQPASNVGRRAKSSVTLNRSGVHKPLVVTAKTAEDTTPHVFTSASKQADKKRLARLQNIHRSDAVSRFGSKNTMLQEPHVTQEKIDDKASKTLTHQLAKTHHTPTPKTAVLSKKEQFIKNTLAKTAVHESATKAADNATKKLKKKAKKSRVGTFATAGLVALLITGYVAYLNIPSISMKVAANRAGFAASMPGYQPSGYSLNGPIAYSPGQVTVNFASNTDDRKFSLRQQPTTWDSNALLENYVTKQSGDYLTYQDQGLSIYIFNGTSAAWVNGQKMYIIEGDNSQLDTDQILKLATSV